MTTQPASTRPLIVVRTTHAIVLTTLALMLATLTMIIPAPAAQADEIGDWLGWINNFRAENGVAPLQLDGEQSGLAEQRNNIDVANGNLVHTSDLTAGVTSHWTKLGENLGMGSSVSRIGTAFANSPLHRDNLLDPAFTHVGIAVAYVGNVMFVTHRFAGIVASSGGGGAPAPTPTPTAPRARPAPTPAPPAPAPAGAAAAAAPLPVPVAPVAPLTVPSPAEPGRVAAVLEALHRVDV